MKAGWKTVQLGEILNVQNGYAFDSKFFGAGGMPLIRIRDIKHGTTTETCYSGDYDDSYVVHSGDYLIGMDGEFRCYMWHGPAALLNQRVCRLTNFSPNVLPAFVCYGINKYLKEIEDVTGYSTVKHLSSKSILSIQFPLPPLAEQKRIVALLDEAFAGIDEAMAKAEATQANAEALLKSYLHATFRTPKPGWHESKLGAVGKVSMCKRILKEQTSPTGDIPFYKIGTFGRQPDAYIPSSIYEDFRGKYPFPNKGDILISAAGTIGRRVRYDGEPAYFQDSNIVWIDNDERLVLNDYLYHVYSACEWNSTSGATISRLYNDDLRNVDILFPPSQSEQKAIAKAMDEVGEEIRKLGVTLQLRLKAHSKLKSSFLSQAFAGELTA